MSGDDLRVTTVHLRASAATQQQVAAEIRAATAVTEGVDAAVKGYGETLDTFFAELSEVGDPATIVARAEALPAPPDLDQVRATARSSAIAMFADPDPVADAGSQAVAETDAVAESIATGDQDTTADEMVASAAQAEGESPDVAGFVAPTTDV